MRLVNYLADEFQKEQGIDLRRDKLALQRLKESAEKAKIELSSTTQTEINLPFITADASGPKHLTMKLTRAKFEALVDDLIQKTVEPCRKALKDAGTVGGRDQRGRPGRRHDAHAEGAGSREAVLRQGAAQGRQPGRSGRHRRRHPGRRAARRRQGRAAARRDPALARHRDAGRRVHAHHRPQHHHPDQEEPGVLDRRGQSERGHHPRLPGRARDGGRQQDARPVRPGRHSAGAARRAADRGRLRHRRQRHRQRVGQGQGDRQGAADPHPGLRRPVRSRHREDGQGRGSPRRGRQEAQGRGRGQEPRRGAGAFDREGAGRARLQGRRGRAHRDRERHGGSERSAQGRRRRRDRSQDQHAGAGFDEARRGHVQAAAGGAERASGRRRATRPPARRKKTWSTRNSPKSTTTRTTRSRPKP